MGSHKNTILINGKLYDTDTGKEVSATKPTVIKPSAQQTQTSHSTVTTIPVRIASKPKTNEASTARMQHDAAREVAHHKPQKATTLHRSYVKKPARKPARAATSSVTQQPSRQIVTSRHSRSNERAAVILKSKRVQKFSNSGSAVTTRTETIPVRSAPKNHNTELDTVFIPKYAPPLQTARRGRQASSQKLFETALHAANHHQPASIGAKTKHRKAASKLVQFGASLMVVLLLGGFFAYHNLSGLAIRTASSKAGFAASLPKYSPTGFALSRTIDARNGHIVLYYNSNIDDSSFTLSQQKTSLDTAALADQLSSTQTPYVTASSKGSMVYIYNNANAAWVKNGIHYTIDGSAQLSTDQLVRIASSL